MHKRNMSQGSISFSSPLRSVPQPPPPTPVLDLHHYQHLQTGDAQSNYDMSSRSTSGYSNGVDITNAMPFGFSQDYSLPRSRQVQVRLPSDQLQQIINAMHPADYSTSQAMPPPPVPLRAIAPKLEVEAGYVSSSGQHLPSAPNTNDANRRGESQSSDISMHPECNSYPTCTVENDQGQIVHSSPATPSTVIKGKKEGSSPTKCRSHVGVDEICHANSTAARDYMSTILATQPPGQGLLPSAEQNSLTSSSPADSSGRKRTRSSMRSLNINEALTEKKEVTKKPPRKASKASISSNASDSAKHVEKSEGTIVLDPVEDKENMMVDV